MAAPVAKVAPTNGLASRTNWDLYSFFGAPRVVKVAEETDPLGLLALSANHRIVGFGRREPLHFGTSSGAKESDDG